VAGIIDGTPLDGFSPMIFDYVVALPEGPLTCPT
jgi:hypothetical protein